MTQKCADPTFGLNEQAWAVLWMLAGMAPQFAPYNDKAGEYDLYLATFPWFNGHEKGIALVLTKKDHPTGPCLVLVVAEHRSSDDLFVDTWEQDVWPRNGPTLPIWEDLKGEENRKLFAYGAVGEAAKYIYEQMKTFYDQGR